MVIELYEPYRALLWSGPGNEAAKQRLLALAGFGDPQAAGRQLDRIAAGPAARGPFRELTPQLLAILARAANPDSALVSFERFAGCAPDQAGLFRYLAENPRALHMLVTLFAGSQFLTEILLRNPEQYPRLTLPEEIAHRKPRPLFLAEAHEALAAHLGPGEPDYTAALDALRHYQHIELLRIGMCDLNGLLDLSSVTTQLSYLADAAIQVCLTTVARQLGVDPAGFAVLAMGKLGGRELNYSSDVDLLFLAESNAAAYNRLGTRLIDALTTATWQGFLYRVDMRLRPWGQVGPLVPTVAGHLTYLRQHARLWEKQALLKARWIAGDEAVGWSFLSAANPLLYELSPEQVRADVHAMKQRTEGRLRQLGRDFGEVKLGEGSIRDVEFVTQYLQLVHGAQHPEVRSGNTLQALARLTEQGLLATDEYQVLADGYIFLRSVEHYLQILEYRQTYTLPSGTGELTYLAHRLGFKGTDAASRFLARFQQHSAAVRAVYLSHLGGGAMQLPDDERASQPATSIDQHLARMSPSYAAAFSEAEIQRHAALAARLDHENPIVVEAAHLEDNVWRVTIVGYDYLGELSLICGLLFVHAFTIVDGNVHTYDTEADPPVAPTRPGTGPAPQARQRADTRRKIVDVFTVRSVLDEPAPDVWTRYAADLTRLVQRLQDKQQREVQGELIKRVAVALHDITDAMPTLYPIDIEIDNEASDRYTILRIDTPDTVGFLYEFTNALALNGVYIAQVAVSSRGNRVRDILYVTDSQGRKISAAEKQRELRAATVLVKHFTHLLPRSPNPELALLHFHEYLGQLFRRPSWPDELASLERSEVLNALARLLGVSDFLWDDFLRMQYTNLFPVVQDVEALRSAKARDQMEAELAGEFANMRGADWRGTLNAFKDREMFRIDMRYIQGHNADLAQFQAELTDLAEVVVSAAYRRCDDELRGLYGEPLGDDGQPASLCVCALGKFGGRELGFASDIELMFVFAGGGKATSASGLSTSEYFEKLVVEFTRAIRARREGVFEVDLRLRPYGSAGSLAVSIESFGRYFWPGGPAWPYERQALIKLRPVAGDRALGTLIAARRDEYVFDGRPFDVAAMKAMRERQVRHLVTPGTVNAKFSGGGLVDLEYLVQGLQITYGWNDASLRTPNTAQAIGELARAGFLTPADHQRLQDAYTFLRRLIDALRMVRGNAKDLAVPPADSEEFAFLARRLEYGNHLARLRNDISGYTAAVRESSSRLLG